MDHRKLLMEILVMLARQEPDQGANLEIAGRAIDEHLARIGLSKEIQRSELEWIHDIIKTRLLQLDG